MTDTTHNEPFPEAIPGQSADDEPEGRSRAAVLEEIKAKMQELSRIEAKTGPSGAIPNASKAMLLDKREADEKNPNSRVRWVNLANSDKALLRTVVQGYKRLSDSEGGRQVGNLVLCAIPRSVYEERLAQYKAAHEARLRAHKNDMEEAFDVIAKHMHDRYGIKLDMKRLLIND
jgi:hypothetical protein